MATAPQHGLLWRLFAPNALKIALGMGLFAAVFHLYSMGRGNPQNSVEGVIENKALDLKFQLRGALKPSGKVTVVAIDERSIARYGRWPWDRSVMAKLIAAIDKHRARVIALDMSFVDPKKSGRFSTLQDLQARYRKANTPPQPEASAAVAGGVRDPATILNDPYANYLSKQLAEGSPDTQLAKAIFDSGRVVWGLFGYRNRDGQGVNLTEEHLATSFERIRPFLVHDLYRLRHDSESGKEIEEAQEVAISSDSVDIGYLNDGVESPLPEFTAATPFFGLMNVYPDPDGVLRRADLLQRYRSELLPSLSLRAVAAYLNSHIYPLWDADARSIDHIRLRIGSAESDGLQLTDAHGALDWVERRSPVLKEAPFEAAHLKRWEDWKEARQEEIDALPEDVEDFPDPDPITLPDYRYGDAFDVILDTSQNGAILINHLGGKKDFGTVSAVDVMDGKAEADSLKGDIALVGVTALGTFDQRVTPFDGMIPGVYVQAAIMDGILSKRLLVRWGWMAPLEALIFILMALLVGGVLPRFKGFFAISLYLLALAACYTALNLLLFSRYQVQLALGAPLIFLVAVTGVVLGFQLVAVDKEKRKVRRAFQHYLAPSVLETVLKDESKLSLNPAKAELSVLFSDIRGFTSISEKLPPEELAVVLNSYLSPMTNIVFDQGGTLDKYMGDAIMAFWGDPIPYKDHALRACRTAVQMIEECDRLAKEFIERGWPPIEIGVGVNTGQVSVGNFGSNVLFDYTVMGDSVNLGSRLEGTNKQYGTHIIISEFTHARVKDQVVARELDSVLVKGKREPVRIFELIAMGEADAEMQAFIETFATALANYKQQLWDAAAASFRCCLEARPEDFASQMYVDRCQAMKDSPPAEDWDGVYTMTTK